MNERKQFLLRTSSWADRALLEMEMAELIERPADASAMVRLAEDYRRLYVMDPASRMLPTARRRLVLAAVVPADDRCPLSAPSESRWKPLSRICTNNFWCRVPGYLAPFERRVLSSSRPFTEEEARARAEDAELAKNLLLGRRRKVGSVEPMGTAQGIPYCNFRGDTGFANFGLRPGGALPFSMEYVDEHWMERKLAKLDETERRLEREAGRSPASRSELVKVLYELSGFDPHRRSTLSGLRELARAARKP